MGRWQPDARGRLGQAAMELYGERGYEQATVAEIAERAGLTARTFFRHFADKREVLFAGSDELGDRLLETLDAAPTGATPLAAVATALEDVCELIGQDHEYSRRRHLIITAHADLQERERTKLASWSDALATGLRQRGVQPELARMAAEAGVAVFRVAFEQWLAGPAQRTLVTTLRSSFELLHGMTAVS